MRSPRAKTLAHLQALVAAATAAAAAAGCGKHDKPQEQPDANPFGSSGYAVVDPLPMPAIEPPRASLAKSYEGKFQLTVTQRDRKPTSVVYELHLVAPPEVSLEDVQKPAEPLRLTTTNRLRKNDSTFFILVPTQDASDVPIKLRLVARGEAGIVDVDLEATGKSGTVKLTDAKE